MIQTQDGRIMTVGQLKDELRQENKSTPTTVIPVNNLNTPRKRAPAKPRGSNAQSTPRMPGSGRGRGGARGGGARGAMQSSPPAHQSPIVQNPHASLPKQGIIQFSPNNRTPQQNMIQQRMMQQNTVRMQQVFCLKKYITT